MVPEKQISEFVTRITQAAGHNLQSIILYGSAASGEFHPDFSNVNLLCVLRETSFADLNKLIPVINWWTRQKRHSPLLLTRQEIERSTDVFSIEFLDMKLRHRMLFGDDVLTDLEVPMHFHRAQLEYELREKLILLRQSLLQAGENKKQLWHLLLTSFSTFITLFRHVLLALGLPIPNSMRETVQVLAARVPFDPSAFLQLVDIREKKAEQRQFDVSDVFNRYLLAVQQVITTVDTMLDSTEPHGS